MEGDERVEVIYPSAQSILRLYAAIYRCTEQEAADQVRNYAALEGAVARPRWYAVYEDADVPLQAAVLTHGIAETQPFIDGNKRAALAAMVQFLELNGFRLTASQQERAAWILELNEGLSPNELAQRIRDNSESFWTR